MQLTNIILPVLAIITAGVEAASYNDCKCHDSNTGLQNDAATEGACKEYASDNGKKVVYSATPHHQCSRDGDNGDYLDNFLWGLKCRRQGENFYQWCWNKKGPFDK